MGVFTVRAHSTASAESPAHVTCGVCRESAAVATRLQLYVFDEAHRTKCGTSWIALDSPLNTILELRTH
jgi:hypothetical protein